MKTSDVLNESVFDFSLIQNMIFYFIYDKIATLLTWKIVS